MPGSSPTMARRLSVSLLNRVDLPTFGRPSMTTVGARTTSTWVTVADVESISPISDYFSHCSLLLGAFTSISLLDNMSPLDQRVAIAEVRPKGCVLNIIRTALRRRSTRARAAHLELGERGE